MHTKTTRQSHDMRLASLKTERGYYESLWQEYDDYIMPGRLRLVPREGKGQKKDHKLVDDTIRHAYRTFVAGMQSGQTSPARPWFRLTTSDPKLREYGPVKDYLYECEVRMRHIMQGSNLYNIMKSGYGDIGQFGQSAYLMVADEVAVARAIGLQTGQYWMAQNHLGRVDTLYRNIQMTVGQVVGKFVAKDGGEMDWSVVSNTIKNLYDKGSEDEWLTVGHAIEPRKMREHGRMDKRNKAYASNYWEEGQNKDLMLLESGFDKNPIMASRWETAGEDVYGSGHPAEIALASVKMLQAEQRKKGMAIDKKVDPPMTGPTSMSNSKSSTLPGSITYVDSVGPHNAYRAALDVSIDLSHLLEDINDTRKSVKMSYYEPLFMAISQMEGIQPKNVFELTQRKEEQLLQLGPVIDRQQHEHLNPLIDWYFSTCAEAGMFPDPPKELEKDVLNIEHISILAQAQRAVATGSIERVVAYVGSLAGMKPTVLDKFDFDQSIDEYADMVGAPPHIIRSDDDVQADRDARAKAEQAAQQAEMAATVAPAMAQTAQAAKLMAETGTIQGDGAMVSNQDLLSRLGIM